MNTVHMHGGLVLKCGSSRTIVNEAIKEAGIKLLVVVHVPTVVVQLQFHSIDAAVSVEANLASQDEDKDSGGMQEVPRARRSVPRNGQHRDNVFPPSSCCARGPCACGPVYRVQGLVCRADRHSANKMADLLVRYAPRAHAAVIWWLREILLP